MPPVVPGAFGFGMDTRAAYGSGGDPTILRVTNLNDSGAGSFRAAAEASGARVILFEVSGTILLESDVLITSPYVTIAGQTAPSPGITISGADAGAGIWVLAQHVLLQHLRIRCGDGGPTIPQTSGHDALLLYTFGAYTCNNVVVDHCSISWSGAKNAQINTSSNPANVTFWRCIISEALYYSQNVEVGVDQPSSLGMLIAGTNVGVSIIQNLFAHCSDRNPEIHEACSVHVINNIIYDWGKDIETAYPWATFMYAPASGPWSVAVMGNRYIAGPPPSPDPLVAIGAWVGDTGSALYLSDNLLDDSQQALDLYYLNPGWGYDPAVGTSPVSLSGITVLTSTGLETYLLSRVGARPVDRDDVDLRIIQEVLDRTGDVISSQDDVGGWPTLAENTRALTTPASPHTVTGSGYTNLEVWLHGYSAAVESSGGGGGSLTITPMAPFMGGLLSCRWRVAPALSGAAPPAQAPPDPAAVDVTVTYTGPVSGTWNLSQDGQLALTTPGDYNFAFSRFGVDVRIRGVAAGIYGAFADELNSAGGGGGDSGASNTTGVVVPLTQYNYTGRVGVSLTDIETNFRLPSSTYFLRLTTTADVGAGGVDGSAGGNGVTGGAGGNGGSGTTGGGGAGGAGGAGGGNGGNGTSQTGGAGGASPDPGSLASPSGPGQAFFANGQNDGGGGGAGGGVLLGGIYAGGGGAGAGFAIPYFIGEPGNGGQGVLTIELA